MLFLRVVSPRCIRHPTAQPDLSQHQLWGRAHTQHTVGRSIVQCPASPNHQQPNNASQRLFSNLDPQTLQHQPGNVWGASALVAGTTVGAGILALPAVTLDSGFGASSTALVACWAYAVVTGLLVAEVNINTLCALGSSGVSLNSMAQRTLGSVGTSASTASLVVLQYALLVAYTAKGAEVVSQLLEAPLPLCTLGFAALLGGVCYLAPPRALDVINTLLVVGVVASFAGLVAVVSPSVDASALLVSDWGALPPALPVMALAFVYQNIVPSIASSLEGDIVKIRTSIVVGTLIPLAMFLVWDAAILGSAAALFHNGDSVAQDVWMKASPADGPFDPVAALRAADPTAAPLIDAFTLVAIATSYIGFVMALTDVFSDALQLPVGARQPLPYALTILPPTIMACLEPDVFFNALEFAGTYGVLILFGILPALMVYSERYGGTTMSAYQLVPGGKGMLVAVAVAGAAVIGNQALGTLQGAL